VLFPKKEPTGYGLPGGWDKDGKREFPGEGDAGHWEPKGG